VAFDRAATRLPRRVGLRGPLPVTRLLATAGQSRAAATAQSALVLYDVGDNLRVPPSHAEPGGGLRQVRGAP
jgi:hypothetical protein